MDSTINNILIQYDELVQKFGKTKQNLEILNHLADKIKIIRQDDASSGQIAMEFSTILTCLVKFNADLETLKYNNFIYSNGIKVTNEMDDLQQCLQNRVIMKTMFDDCFPLLEANDPLYSVGEVGQCFISNILDLANDICHIVTMKNLPSSKLSYGNRLIPLTKKPEFGEMFIFNFNSNLLVRAVRTEDLLDYSSKYSALLIDIGCTMQIDSAQNGQYRIDDELKTIPACAIKCQVMEIKTDQNLNLLNILHRKIFFRVIKYKNNVLYVNIFDRDTNPFRNEIAGDMDFYKIFEYNDFRKSRPFIPMDFNLRQSSYSEPTNSSMETNGSNSGIGVDSALNEYLSQKNLEKRPVWNDFNAIEKLNLMSEHYVKPIGREFKVNVFDECDGRTLISQYDEEDQKKLNVILDYSIRDRVENSERFKTSPENAVTEAHLYPQFVEYLPKLRHSYELHVTNTIDVENFHVQIPAVFQELSPSIFELEDEINSSAVTFKEFGTPPAPGEYIVAQYSDNRFYRAKIINYLDDTNVRVFYVDHGNCEYANLNQIYKWDERWNCLPAQLFHCRLHRVKRIKEFDFEAIQMFEQYVLRKVWKGKVVRIIENEEYPTLVLQLTSDLGTDVADVLCDKNMALYE